MATTYVVTLFPSLRSSTRSAYDSIKQAQLRRRDIAIMVFGILTIFLVLSTTTALLPSRRAPQQPSQCSGYQVDHVDENDSGFTAFLSIIDACNLHGEDVTNLRLQVEYQTESRLHVLIEDVDSRAFQVQEQALPRPLHTGVSEANSSLHFQYSTDPFWFQVIRKKTNEVLFDTSESPLIFQSQYLQLRTNLPQDANLYGLGEHTDSFLLPTSGYTRTLWNAESPFVPNRTNLYGSHPVYFDHRGNNGTHGVFLLSASGMDIHIDQTPSGQRYLEYSTIGGVLDFYFLAGPSPVEVSRQYTEVVGLPAMSPYWILGFHQCKYGWKSLDEVIDVTTNYSKAGIPLETMWGDIDYMHDHQDFTTDPRLFPTSRMRDYISTLHKNNQHYIVILDPGIRAQPGYAPFDHGVAKSAFLKHDDGALYHGRQWAGDVVWPDWLAPGAQDWWTSEILTFTSPSSGIDVDGLWVDMNEASNMCRDAECLNTPSNTSSRPRLRLRQSNPSHPSGPPRLPSESTHQGLPGRHLTSPPYTIADHVGPIYGGTLSTALTNADSTTQYDTHNLYGHLMASATRRALLSRSPTLRPFVLTRSTFAGTGAHAAHWFGDNASTWWHYAASIRQMLAFTSLHGMPMVGSDVCGFNLAAEEKMCARWALLGAFQPFYRNHADTSAPSQEFYRWGLVTEAAKRAIDVRYRLLDYVYTALHDASTDGTPVARPLWFEWPGDSATFGIDTQWLWGEGLLVSPVTGVNATGVVMYLPRGEEWYDFWSGKRVGDDQKGWVRIENVGWTEIPVHVRGGSIMPMRVRSGMTTAEVRGQNFTVLVAPDGEGKAKGRLYLDDGVSLDVGGSKSEVVFTWEKGRFEMSGTFGFATDVVVESVTVLGENKTRTGPWGLRKGFSFQF